MSAAAPSSTAAPPSEAQKPPVTFEGMPGFPREGDYDTFEAFKAALDAYEYPKPPKVDRATRRFKTSDEAAAAAAAFFGVPPTAKLQLPAAVAGLYRQTHLEQRSPGWFEARRKAITGSDLAAAIGENQYQRCEYVIRKKLEGSNAFQGNHATKHGVENEDCALHRYERETGAFTLDFGLVSHHRLFDEQHGKVEGETPQELFDRVHDKERHPELYEYTWLKASPDGVALHRQPDGSLKAVLLEIKCPVSKFRRGYVQVHYRPQLQVLMELMDLEEAHFVQYEPAGAACEEKYDLVVVPRDRERFAEIKAKAAHTWQTICLRREGLIEDTAERMTIDEVVEGGYFPAEVRAVAPGKRKWGEVPREPKETKPGRVVAAKLNFMLDGGALKAKDALNGRQRGTREEVPAPSSTAAE